MKLQDLFEAKIDFSSLSVNQIADFAETAGLVRPNLRAVKFKGYNKHDREYVYYNVFYDDTDDTFGVGTAYIFLGVNGIEADFDPSPKKDGFETESEAKEYMNSL